MIGTESQPASRSGQSSALPIAAPQLRFWYGLLLAGLLSWTPMAVRAAETSSTARITIDQALHLASVRHPAIAAKRSERESADRFLDAAQWQRYPSFSVSSASGSGGDSGTTTRLQQPLWTGGRITADISSAQARVAAAEAGIGEVQQSIMLRTASAYVEALRMRRRLEVATRNLSEHQRLFELISRRMDSQVSSLTDQTLAQSRLQQAASEKIQFAAALANAESTLTQLLGERFTVARLAEPAPRKPVYRDVDEALAAAYEFSPQLSRLTAEVSLARADLDSRRSVLWPQIAARVEHLNSSNNLLTQNQSRAQLVIEFQPGAGLGAGASIQGAAARISSAQSGIDATRLEITDRVRNDWSELQSLRDLVAPLRTIAVSSAQVTESFLRQYTVGRKSWLDVLNAQREATLAQYALADVESNLLSVGLRLELVTGSFSARRILRADITKFKAPR